MKLVRTIGWPVILSFFLVLVSHGAEFADTSFRTNNGDLLTKGMSKAEVIVRFRRPDEKDVITSGLDVRPRLKSGTIILSPGYSSSPSPGMRHRT